MISGWVVLYGQVLIIVANPHLLNGPISIRILVLWICAAFQKIFITIIKAGGQIKMCCIFHHIGTGAGWIKEGKPIDVWVNSNADDVELFLNGKSLGKKDMPRNSHLKWTVNYEPGKLEAIAYKKGKKLTAKVETTDQPAEVVITPYKTTMLADGKDATVINISVVDKEGREVPDADNMITILFTGRWKNYWRG